MADPTEQVAGFASHTIDRAIKHIDSLELQLGGLQSCIAESLGLPSTPRNAEEVRPILARVRKILETVLESPHLCSSKAPHNAKRQCNCYVCKEIEELLAEWKGNEIVP